MPEPSPSKNRTSRILRRVRKIVLWLIASIVFLFVLIIILIQVPAIQNYIKNKVVVSLSEKLKTKVEIGHISLKLNGGLKINHIFVADDKKDTLLYAETFSVTVNPVPLFHKRVIFSSVSLAGTRLRYTVRDTSGATNIDFITKAFADTSKKPQPKKTSAWQIELKNVNLTQVGVQMSNKADSSVMNLLIGYFEINLRNGNLQQMNFDVRNIRLENTSLAMSSYNKVAPAPKDTSETQKKKSALKTSVTEIRLKNISFTQTDSVTGSRSVYYLRQVTIHPEKIDLNNQLVSLKDLSLKKGFFYMNNGKETAKSKPRKQEQQKKQSITFRMKQADISLDSVHMVNNSIPQDSAMGYMGNLSISSINISLNSIQYSSTSWKGDIRNLQFRDDRTLKEMRLVASANSDNGNIILQKLNLKLGNSLIACRGSFNMADTARKKIPDFTFNAQEIRIYKADLSPYLPRNPSFSRLPADVYFTGDFASQQEHVKGNGRLMTDIGSIAFNADMDQPLSDDPAYTLSARINRFNAGKLMDNDTLLGNVTGNIQVHGKGIKPETMNATAVINIDSIFLMKRTYRAIRLSGSVASGKINLITKITDEVINLNLALNGQIRNNLPQVNVQADIAHLDLHAMGFMKDTMILSGILNASYHKYSQTRFEFYTDTSIISVVTPKTKLTLHNKIDYYAGNDSVEGFVGSDFGTLTYRGNIGADKIPELLKQYFGQYYTLQPDTLTSTRDKYFTFKLAVNDLSPAKDLIPVNLSVPDGGVISGQFFHNKLVADVKFKQFIFNTLKLDTINMHVEGSDSALNMALTAAAFQNPGMVMRNIDVRNVLDNGQFQFRVKFENAAEKPWFNFGVKARKETDGYRLSMQEPMVMNFIPWTIDRNNEILYSKQGIALHNVSLMYKGNGITIQNIQNNPDAIRVGFQNLGLSFLSQVLKGDSTTIAGKINGTASLFSIKAEKKKFAADIGITDIRSGGYQLGDMTLTANNSANPDRLDLLLKLANQYMSMNAEGYYGMQPTQPTRVNITANNLDLAEFSALLKPQLEDTKGKINASVLFTGTPSDPNLQGSIRFTDVGFRSAAANTNFAINNQEIQFTGKRIHFPDFRINDTDGNPFTISGDVVFTDLKNISFRMHMASQGFLAYDAYFNKQLDKESKIILTSDMDITGDLHNPVVKANIKLDEGSKVFYEMANKGGNFSEEGIIEFEGAAPIDTQQNASIMQNLMLTANITLNDNTPVTILTDPAKGDILHVTTGGRMTLSERPMQSPRMIGKIDISDGDYTMTLAGFKKTFTLKPQSTITWNGDIASPEFKLLAYYEIRTSPAPLFPEEGPTGASQLPNTLPFRVGLNLSGSVAKPEINFDISLPQEYQDSYADVTTKLQQINSDPTEVNKQAMFLVLFGTFDISKFTDPSNLSLSTFSTMSNAGGTNALISRTLNQFAAQQIKFATLHFDLQSYDNLGGTTTEPSRTELDVNASRKFIDNRLDASVGGNIVLQGDEKEQNRIWYKKITPIFNFQYMFNKPRTWGFKVFRQEDYRGILEGKVGSLGAGVLFQKDYNKPKDLFKKAPANEGTKRTLAKE